MQYRLCTATPVTCTTSPTWGSWTSHTHTGTGTTATIGSLTNGTAYQVQVKATSSVGDSAWSPSGQGTPAPQPPDAPAAPTVTAKNQSIAVSWTAPDTNGSVITGYAVQYRSCTATPTTCTTSPTWGSWTSHTHTGTGITATIGSLTNGTAYQVQIKADSSAGNSTWSDSSSATPSTVPSPPGVTLSGVVGSPTSSLVSWTLTDDGGSPVTGYEIDYRCSPGNGWASGLQNLSPWAVAAGTTSRESSISECSSRLSSSEYRFKVRAQNANGWSTWTHPFATTSSPAALEASAITAALSGGNMTVSWSSPHDGGLEITDYDVRYREKDTDRITSGDQPGSWVTLTGGDDPGSATTATIAGLIAGTVYQVQVRASNIKGEGDWSSSLDWPQTPSVPTALTATVRHQALGVSWTAPASNGAAISDYDVQYRACTATPATCATNPTWGAWTDRTGETVSDTATAATVTGLTNGTAYQVQVRASNSVGDGAWSTAASAVPAVRAPDAPATPTLTVRASSLGVSWTAPASNGAAISDYDVQYRACTATPATCATNPTWGAWTDRTGETVSDTATAATVTGLTNGTAYQVQVRASNSVGDGAWSTAAVGTPAVVPGAPTAPTLTARNQSLDVSWSAPSDDGGAAVTGYKLQHCDTAAVGASCDDTTGTTWSTASSFTAATTSGTITGLTNGNSHKVRVRAVNSVGDGAWSASASATPTPEKPGVPAAPVLTVQDHSLGVAWSAPASNGAAITDYNVQYRKQNSDDTWPVSWTSKSHTGTAITTVISGLTNGSRYQVQVQAVNSKGAGGWSLSSTATPGAAPSAPSAPTLTASPQQISVSWSAPSDDGGLAVTGYKVRHCDNSTGCDTDSEWTVKTLSSASPTSTTISGLTNGTTYRVQVAAVNSQGTGGWSTHATAKPTDKPAAPGAPTLVSGSGSLAVSWSAPADNGLSITGYKVRHCGGETADCTDGSDDWTSKNASGTSTTVSSLTNGTSYSVEVAAVNGKGTSGWSESAIGTPGAPAAPSRPTLTAGDSQITVSWSAPADRGESISGYDVHYCNSTDDDCTAGVNWSDAYHYDTTTTVTVTGLTNGKAYRVRVRAENSRDSGGWSPEATATPAAVADTPGAPTLTVKNRALDVSWSAPSGDGGAAITGYKVRRCDDSTGCDVSSEWTAKTLTGTSTSTTLSSLTNGTTYQVQVAAVNRVGDSRWSDSTNATPATAPSAPSTPEAESGHQKLRLNWDAPSDNGSVITGYDVEYRKRNSDNTWPATWTSHAHADTSTTATIDSLTNGSSYQMRVRATNAIGDSGWSSTVTANPKAVPEAPESLTLTAGDTQITADWQAPSVDNGATVTGYRVQYRKRKSDSTWPTSWTTKSHSGTGTSSTITGLTNGGLYQVRVRATTAGGDGLWARTTATPSGKPSAPSALTLTVGDTQLTVVWSAPFNGGSAITGYDVYYCDTTDTANPCSNDDSWTDASHYDTTTTATITGLTNDTAYKVRVRATNDNGTGGWSPSATGTPAAPPDAPGGIAFVSGNGSLTVNWDTPTTNGATITGYKVRHCDSSDSDDDCYSDYDDWTTKTLTGTSTTTTISGLTNGNDILVEVQATSNQGTSSWSSQETGKPGAPAAPSAPSLTAGDGQISVSWSAPANRGSDITGYEVGYCNDTDGDCTSDIWSSEFTYDANTRTLDIQYLDNGKRYKVRVRAENGRGYGGWSSTSSTTPSA